MPEVVKMGRFYECDAEGYLVNDTSRDYLEGKWLAAVEDATTACIESFGDSLRSLYVRGSVPRGLAVEGISDLDLICLLHDRNTEPDRGTTRTAEIERPFLERHPFVGELEVVITDEDEYLGMAQGQFTVKVRGLLLHGEDMAPGIHKFRPDRELARALDYSLEDSINFFRKSAADGSVPSGGVRWMAKRLLRTGMSAVVERAGAYSPDLWPQYDCFSGFYPERERIMYRVLELAINPEYEEIEFAHLLDDFGVWLAGEYRTVTE